MAKLARSRQAELRFPARDGSRRYGTKGNKGGRKPKGAKPMESHRPRAAITAHTPVHVTLRLASDLGNLRRGRVYKAIRRATMVAARERDATIVHISIQSNHLHLLVEAADAARLGEGMRRFAISAARQLNATVSSERGTRRAGKVFTDRYHAEVITVPRQARHALAYVLNNWRRHKADRTQITRRWLLDPFSSAIQFRGWAGLPEDFEWTPRASYEPLEVGEPASWLLRIGWRRAGTIALDEVPGPVARA